MVQDGNTSCRYCTWVRYCSGIFVWWGRWDRFESEEGLRVDDICKGGWRVWSGKGDQLGAESYYKTCLPKINNDKPRVGGEALLVAGLLSDEQSRRSFLIHRPG
jgi:hypothetical protein